MLTRKSKGLGFSTTKDVIVHYPQASLVSNRKPRTILRPRFAARVDAARDKCASVLSGRDERRTWTTFELAYEQNYAARPRITKGRAAKLLA
jgi:hypothetical protein